MTNDPPGIAGDYDPLRDGTRSFHFDDASYPCFPIGSTWNGFDNVSISARTRDVILEDWRRTEGFDQETLREFAELPIQTDGRISLGWAYATQLDPDESSLRESKRLD